MPQGNHHLDQEQRCQLYILKERGDSSATIVGQLVVDSTIHREIQRNRGQRGYRYKQAEESIVDPLV